MCRCIPVVKKIPGLSKKDWLINFGSAAVAAGFSKMNYDNFPGIAYGVDDIEYAEKTISEFGDFYKKCNQFEQDSVKNFVNKVDNHFFHNKIHSQAITASKLFPKQKWNTFSINVVYSYVHYNDKSYIINYNTNEIFINVGSNHEIRIEKVGDINNKTFLGNGFLYTPVLSAEEHISPTSSNTLLNTPVNAPTKKSININTITHKNISKQDSLEDNLVKKTYNGVEFYVNSRNGKVYLLKEVGTWTSESGIDFSM